MSATLARSNGLTWVRVDPPDPPRCLAPRGRALTGAAAIDGSVEPDPEDPDLDLLGIVYSRQAHDGCDVSSLGITEESFGWKLAITSSGSG
jgi:hypothetical protein